jgi:hypothetical protein
MARQISSVVDRDRRGERGREFGCDLRTALGVVRSTVMARVLFIGFEGGFYLVGDDGRDLLRELVRNSRVMIHH